jgi:hypothetical protein
VIELFNRGFFAVEQLASTDSDWVRAVAPKTGTKSPNLFGRIVAEQ